MTQSNPPKFDVPFICPECLKVHGANGQMGAFPEASVCEFRYKGGQNTWRMFTCCPVQQRVCEISLKNVTEHFKEIWRR